MLELSKVYSDKILSIPLVQNKGCFKKGGFSIIAFVAIWFIN
jgi:hypothetical protein